MASVNKVMLLGNLTRDPEIRYTPKGTAVTDLGMAINVSQAHDASPADQLSSARVTSTVSLGMCPLASTRTMPV